ncbi:hypothetical protein PV328_003681 [Microctonus aethiopoides]|uniref:Uncharacterized protein n=1 Tax=Microctonus aethiopoides TaxID=144406 RepID=A0AA39KKW6_9HYME|nr:hypothetical protein PV328_003681 [Microctonus aethiopoides]
MIMHRRERENAAHTTKKYQSQNDIKKLRRENEQLRREIWCLREEYDKLEEILKHQKNLSYSDNDNEDENDDEEDDDDDEDEEDYSNGESISSTSNIEEDGRKASDEKKNENKEKMVIPNEMIQDELLENAENQKLSTEKTNRLHVDFDQLSIVTEEEESIKKDKETKDSEELCESMLNMHEEGYSLRHPFNWTINSTCPVIPTTNEHSINYATPAISTLINIDSVSVQPSPPPLPSPSTIGWDGTIFQGDTRNTLTTMDPENCAESIVRVGASMLSCQRMPRDTSGHCIVPDTTRSFIDQLPEVNTNIIAPSSSSENTGSTIIQKTSPDICIAGCVASPRNYSSTDQLSLNNPRDSLSKSYSCDELAKSNDFSSIMMQGIEAKSLPDNTNPRAFKSQLKVQLCKLPSETEMPPEMSPLNWTSGQSSLYASLEPLDNRQHRLLRQFQRHNCQVTSFECPTPRRLTLPSSMSFQPNNEQRIKSDRRIVPVWPPQVPTTLKVVDTQTQTPQSRSSSHSGCSRSGSQSHSSDDQNDKKDTKSSKLRKKMRKSPMKKVTTTTRLSDESKHYRDDKSERRSSSSGLEWHKKHQKMGRYSHGTKQQQQQRSSRSLSITQVPETPEINNLRDTTVSSNSRGTEKQRKSSISSEKLPWCACWGNGCL